ncbi:hypothetical protein SUNI508_04618 [Seiridium unicorne]|uniref:Uncharacterized protein n=1 Tax=Seiridium unicorne TaxID=138068 RepID=A0ABR2V8V8_9PEZI
MTISGETRIALGHRELSEEKDKVAELSTVAAKVPDLEKALSTQTRKAFRLKTITITELRPIAKEAPGLRKELFEQKDRVAELNTVADKVPGLERELRELRPVAGETGSRFPGGYRAIYGLRYNYDPATKTTRLQERIGRLERLANEVPGLQKKFVPGLELETKKETEQHKKAADRLLQVDHVANFFTWHHTGQVGRISLWVQLINQLAYPIPGLELGQDDKAPWTMMNWWPAEGGRSVAKLDRNSTRDLVITAYGWILAGTIDEQLCHVVCILTGHMENNEEASVGPVLELLARWPDTPRLAETSLRIFEALDNERSHQSVVIAARLLGDGGARLKTWIRANVVDGDEVEDEVMAELLPKVNFMYVVEMDFAFVVLPGTEGFVWVFDLESNSLRMVSMSRAQWPSTKIFRQDRFQNLEVARYTQVTSLADLLIYRESTIRTLRQR